MGRVYGFLGLSTGVIIHGLDDRQRHDAYACDITYGTNNEYGFDYLRDNMKYEMPAMVHAAMPCDRRRGGLDPGSTKHARADHLRSLDDRSDLYVTIDKLMPSLVKEDSSSTRAAHLNLTEKGNDTSSSFCRIRGICTKAHV